MVKLPSIEEMLQAGMHFGHRTSKWHPKMAPYIFSERNGVHVIDLEKSRELLGKALNVIEETVAEGKVFLVVGTKPQVKEQMKKMAIDTNIPYVVEGWIGGVITNFAIIKKAIKKFKDLTSEKETGLLSKYTKKERIKIDREIARLDKNVGGLTSLTRQPDVMFVWDIKEEQTAVTEGKKKGVTIIGLCDTNTNPKNIDYVIPANDDATKTVKLVLNLVEEAIKAGQEKAKKLGEKTAAEAEAKKD
jgi:small subunit ribosomal protein S2